MLVDVVNDYMDELIDNLADKTDDEIQVYSWSWEETDPNEAEISILFSYSIPSDFNYINWEILVKEAQNKFNKLMKPSLPAEIVKEFPSLSVLTWDVWKKPETSASGLSERHLLWKYKLLVQYSENLSGKLFIKSVVNWNINGDEKKILRDLFDFRVLWGDDFDKFGGTRSWDVLQSLIKKDILAYDPDDDNDGEIYWSRTADKEMQTMRAEGTQPEWMIEFEEKYGAFE